MSLSVKAIEAAKYALNRDRVADGNGLYLRLRESGVKVFQIRHTVEGKRAWITLGAYPDLGLKSARDLAGIIRGQLNSGKSLEMVRAALVIDSDPTTLEKAIDLVSAAYAADQKEAAGMTFREVAKIWFDKKKPGLSNGKHIQQNWNTLETYVFPTIGHVQIADISRKDVISAIQPIWLSKNETARRTLARVVEVFETALVMELREANPAVFNPKIALGLVNSRVKHFGSLPFEQMPEFWLWLQTVPCEEDTRQNAMLMVLTVKRSGEARSVDWDHINLLDASWTTPAHMMKMRREHRIPLCPQVLIIMENMRVLAGSVGTVFAKPGNVSGLISENTVCLLFKRFAPHITAHGVRSSFKTWARVKRYDKDAVEFCLAHEQDGLEAAYQRSDLFEERVKIMSDWAEFVTAGNDPRRLGDLL